MITLPVSLTRAGLTATYTLTLYTERDYRGVSWSVESVVDADGRETGIEPTSREIEAAIKDSGDCW